jgi:23S rRNA pseudouridine1911/1915/1917 synthase
MIIKVESEKGRIDKFLFEVLEKQFYSRTGIQRLIKDGKILVNDKKVKPSHHLKINDLIFIPDRIETEPSDLEAREIPLDIVYEDRDILIINKTAGQIVHPGIGHTKDTIANGLKAIYGDALPDIGGKERPGIIHRLDKDTIGLLIIALTQEAYYKLIQMQKKRSIEKYYLGICWGEMKADEGEIKIAIGRSLRDRKLFAPNGINPREAITKFWVLKRQKRFSLIKFQLVTGRTHQIRVHMKAIGHPIVGDIQYSNKGRKIKISDSEIVLNHHLLCAQKLVFCHPITNKELVIELDYGKCLDFENFFPYSQLIRE